MIVVLTCCLLGYRKVHNAAVLSSKTVKKYLHPDILRTLYGPINPYENNQKGSKTVVVLTRKGNLHYFVKRQIGQNLLQEEEALVHKSFIL